MGDDAETYRMVRESCEEVNCLKFKICEQADQLRDYEDAKSCLTALFASVAPQCEVLDSLSGVASQISNYLAGQADLLRQAVEVVEVVVDGVYGFQDESDGAMMCVFCEVSEYGDGRCEHKKGCLTLKAQALLPDMEKALEVK